jgi:hypothetical protein
MIIYLNAYMLCKVNKENNVLKVLLFVLGELTLKHEREKVASEYQ